MLVLVLVLAGVALTFSTVAGMRLCFELVLNTGSIIQRCFLLSLLQEAEDAWEIGRKYSRTGDPS